MLQTDASIKHGMGYAHQKRKGAIWKLVECNSHWCIDQEYTYSRAYFALHYIQAGNRSLRMGDAQMPLVFIGPPEVCITTY